MICLVDPSASTTSTAHQSARSGTASCATSASVRSYSNEPASTALASARNARASGALITDAVGVSPVSPDGAWVSTRPPSGVRSSSNQTHDTGLLDTAQRVANCATRNRP